MHNHSSTRFHTPGKKNKHLFWLVLALVLVLTLAIGTYTIWSIRQRPAITRAGNAVASLTGGETGKTFRNTITKDGVEYTYRHEIKNILFLGVDHAAASEASGAIGSGGRSDTMFLFIIDPRAENSTILEISRDTMVPVDFYGDHDNYLYSGNMQLTMQYAFGSSARRSCWLTKNKISELLCGIPIAGTLSYTMDGIAAAVDSLGGVEITIPEDYTELDPAFTAGTKLTLDGQLATSYVRYRDTGESGSNDVRMHRQEQFLQALYKKLAATDEATFNAFQSAVEPYLYTDIDMDTLHALYSYRLADDMYKLPGKTVAGDLHDEYYVEETELQEQLLTLLYEPKS